MECSYCGNKIEEHQNYVVCSKCFKTMHEECADSDENQKPICPRDVECN